MCGRGIPSTAVRLKKYKKKRKGKEKNNKLNKGVIIFSQSYQLAV